MPPPELRPLNAGQILDTSLKIFTSHWWTFMRIVLYIVAPLELISALVLGTALGVDENADQLADDEVALAVGGLFVAVAILLLEQVLASAACFRAVSDAYMGDREPNWSSSLGFSLRKFGPLLWVSFLTLLFVLLGLIALIIGAVFLYVAFAVAVPALVGEDVRGMAALKRSYNLVKGRWWSTFGVLILAGLLAGIVQAILSSVVSALLGIAIDTDPVGGFVFVNALANIAASVVTIPFSAAVLVVLYYDLRVRKEGLDIELLARGLGDESAPPTA
jgi:hypothetical protein